VNASQARLFDEPGPLCWGCPYGELCGAQLTAHACRAEITHELDYHPRSPITLTYIEKELRSSLAFEDVRAKPASLPSRPPFVAQVRLRSAFRGHLHASVYGLRADQVVCVTRRGLHVRTAEDVRHALDLGRSQRLVVLFFTHDALLESYWSRRAPLAQKLAQAGFDLVASPSYSTYTPRPRTEHLIELRRSLLFFEALQDAGVVALPRLGWVVPQDAARLARWANRQEALTTLGVDMQTLRARASWQAELALLAAFDEETGGRLNYLINGPGTRERLRAIGRFLGVRSTITHARSVGPAAATLPAAADRLARFAREEREWLALCTKAQRGRDSDG
jgi:Domain of unknown function (DUF4417)